jgi:diguanylate cyclase (GGDEF)-like protein
MVRADRSFLERADRGPLFALLARLGSLPPLGQVGRPPHLAVLRGAMDLFGADAAWVGFWTSPSELRRYRLVAGDMGREVHEDVLDPGANDGPLRQALRRGNAILAAPGPAFDPLVEGFPGSEARSALFLGLRMRDEPPAVLALYRFEGDGFSEEDRKLGDELGPVLSTAVDNLRRFLRAEELSITDGLTGVYNYRYLKSALDREVARAKRYREEFAIIMLDVDHLKEYNDAHGHLQGSEVLRRLANVVVGELRATDILAKYGGDEFVIIMLQTRREGARVLAERIRDAVSGCGFPGGDVGAKITTSLGIAQFPDDGETTRSLLEAADRALYVAKRAGRNRVALGGPGSDEG